ncbi:MAG: maltokinase N-terminal cap-like domain-containing protein [Pseudomonadota bacterium]
MSPDLRALDETHLGAWLAGQRWFGAKGREVASTSILEAIVLAPGDPALALAVAEARFAAGTHELYQLLLALSAGRAAGEDDVGAVDGFVAREALAEPAAAAALARLLRDEATVAAGQAGQVVFRWLDEERAIAAEPSVRAMGAEQSNSSAVIDDAFVLKVFRRVEAGVNPELEMLRFLTDHGFDAIAPLAGWYDLESALVDATLGVVQRYVHGGRDGWERVVEALADGRGEDVLDDLGELGCVIGRMHTVLASEGTDPAFAPEEPGDESLSLLTATIDEEIERVFLDLPRDEPALQPIAGRGPEVRDRLALLTHVAARGRLIRHHGDLHLGQTMLVTSDPERRWIVLDFEGEPARPLLERRRKRSPLRDVAGMLRSFAYAASASELQRGVAAPAGWEDAARERFLKGYFDTVEPSLLPPGQGAATTLLTVFELEKAVYELRYEVDNRPDWVSIPVAGIARLLEEPIA